ncbi:MAG: Yip1 family protein [Candidatus Zhuqueibacterota bacterium]
MNEVSTSTPTRELNFFQRFMGIFFSPRETYESINRKPDWVMPLLVMVLITVAFTMITLPISMPEQMQKQREKLEEQGQSAEQIDAALAMGEKFGKIIGPIGAAVGTGLILALMSAIFLFIGNFILGGQTTFLKMFSVYLYTSLIGILGMLVKLPLILSKNTTDISFSLAMLMPADASKSFLYYLLKSIEIFSIWHFALLAIAFSVLYKFSMKKSAWVMVVLFGIYVLISATLMKIFA